MREGAQVLPHGSRRTARSSELCIGGKSFPRSLGGPTAQLQLIMWSHLREHSSCLPPLLSGRGIEELERRVARIAPHFTGAGDRAGGSLHGHLETSEES